MKNKKGVNNLMIGLIVVLIILALFLLIWFFPAAKIAEYFRNWSLPR